jgi:hypothetical protein
MRGARIRPAVAAWLAAGAVVAACGPGEPPSPAPPPAPSPTPPTEPSPAPAPPGPATPPSGGGGGDTGGGGGGGGAQPGSGVATAWTVVTGGAGDEWVQDVAAAPGGAAVALTVIESGDGRVEQIGLLEVDGSGREQWRRTYGVDASVRFPRGGALSTGPAGEVYLAVACTSGCAGLGAPLNGSALVQLSPSGDPRRVVRLAGEVASQPVVDPPGNVAVATSASGANVVRSLDPSGAQRWEVSLRPAVADVALAADAGGNVLVGRGSEVTKIDAAGKVAWTRQVGATVAGIGGSASGVVAVAGATPNGPAVLLLQPDGTDGPVRPLPGGVEGILVEVGAGRRVGAVTSADGCGATVTAFEVDGSAPWTRPVAAGDCSGSELAAQAVTVTTSGAVIVGGALRGPVDLGKGTIEPRRTDGFLAAFGP